LDWSLMELGGRLARPFWSCHPELQQYSLTKCFHHGLPSYPMLHYD